MHYLNSAVSIDWRVSLVPAAAVIPAPVAYTNIAAVKKLVVECRVDSAVGLVQNLVKTVYLLGTWWSRLPCTRRVAALCVSRTLGSFDVVASAALGWPGGPIA